MEKVKVVDVTLKAWQSQEDAGAYIELHRNDAPADAPEIGTGILALNQVSPNEASVITMVADLLNDDYLKAKPGEAAELRSLIEDKILPHLEGMLTEPSGLYDVAKELNWLIDNIKGAMK